MGRVFGGKVAVGHGRWKQPVAGAEDARVDRRADVVGGKVGVEHGWWRNHRQYGRGRREKRRKQGEKKGRPSPASGRCHHAGEPEAGGGAGSGKHVGRRGSNGTKERKKIRSIYFNLRMTVENSRWKIFSHLSLSAPY